MARHKGEIGTTQAARLLELHKCTLWRWAERIEGGDLVPPPLKKVRRDATNRLWWDRAEVLALQAATASAASAAGTAST